MRATNDRPFNHGPRRRGFAGICFNKFQQIKTHKTYSALAGESRGSRVKNGDPRNREPGTRVMDNECANASRRHPHKSMQPRLCSCWSASRSDSDSDSYSESVGWMASLSLRTRVKSTTTSKAGDVMLYRAKTQGRYYMNGRESSLMIW